MDRSGRNKIREINVTMKLLLNRKEWGKNTMHEIDITLINLRVQTLNVCNTLPTI